MKIDLIHQVKAILPRRFGGTGNTKGYGTAVVIPMSNYDAPTLALGSVVQIAYPLAVKQTTVTDDEDVLGVVVGYFRDADGQLVEDDVPTAGVAAVMVRGKCKVRIGANVAVADYVYAHATDGTAYGDSTVDAGAFGRFLTAGLVADGLLVWMMVGLHGGGGGGGSVSPLTTKGDLYGHSTIDARVPVGSNGQVLSADSGDAEGLTWITPFLPTGIAAKGDIVVGTANDTPAVLTAGADGRFLQADAASGAGLRWRQLDITSGVVFTFLAPLNNDEIAIPMPYDCTVTGWALAGDATGSAVIDVWHDPLLANNPPTNADAMPSTVEPEIVGATQATGTVAGWTSTAITKGGVLLAHIDSTSGFGRLSLTIYLTRQLT